VRFNTLFRPKRWVLRILQAGEPRLGREADSGPTARTSGAAGTLGRAPGTAPGFVPCRGGVFTDNLVLFRSDEIAGAVNIGPHTAAQTFRFARNWWYALDAPARSAPSLPTPEKAGVIGRDPRLRDPDRGDLRPQAGSPAAKVGAQALAKQ
jgi:hypothetical protein